MLRGKDRYLTGLTRNSSLLSKILSSSTEKNSIRVSGTEVTFVIRVVVHNFEKSNFYFHVMAPTEKGQKNEKEMHNVKLGKYGMRKTLSPQRAKIGGERNVMSA